jgi:hypothetical protein
MPGFNDFLSRIQTDYEFYLQFQENPEETLKPYELNSKERAALTEPGPQLWDHLGEVVSGAESPGVGISGDSDAPLKWRSCTTQTGWAKIDLPGSLELQFNYEAVLGRPTIRQMLAQIRAANTHRERLTALSDLIAQVE